MTFDEWYAGPHGDAGHHMAAKAAWDAATAAERERIEAAAIGAVWAARDAEAKAVSKGCAEYTPEFRAASLVEQLVARIREGGGA